MSTEELPKADLPWLSALEDAIRRARDEMQRLRRVNGDLEERIGVLEEELEEATAALVLSEDEGSTGSSGDEEAEEAAREVAEQAAADRAAWEQQRQAWDEERGEIRDRVEGLASTLEGLLDAFDEEAADDGESDSDTVGEGDLDGDATDEDDDS